ncbi:uncharacterized protein LOC126900628 [Daktulosphaira vitifoliae]|uniref:uncharacterized protein LOC126900628 n=1 Tax=Daktulosphaira vitifoliae TaxID=58002 RepID=UPI0021AAD32D|nr:uncharacterized protein LOC126900628 [Daktulosphaira vitifoliae]
MAICEEVEYMDVSFNSDKNETSIRKILHVNRTPTPRKPNRHWSMSTELLRSQYEINHICKPKVYNPFNENLMQRLGETTISPNVFAKAISPGQENEFKWNIDDVSKLNPVHIEDECMVEEQIDDETESKLQETIDKYFYMKHKIPSPWNNEIINWESKRDNSSSTPMSTKKTELTRSREISTQTDLSFPSILPDHIEQILKPYFLNSTQNKDSEASFNKDTSTLRRKLFFLNDNDDPISPVEMKRNQPNSPLISCFVNSTETRGPVIGNHLGVQELPLDCHVPIDVSPIIISNDKENTPPKDKSGDFVFMTPVSTLSMPKRRRTNKISLTMENSSESGYQTLTMSLKDMSSITSFGHSSKNILFSASTPT